MNAMPPCLSSLGDLGVRPSDGSHERMLGVQSKSLTHTGETGNWGFPPTVRNCAWSVVCGTCVSQLFLPFSLWLVSQLLMLGVN